MWSCESELNHKEHNQEEPKKKKIIKTTQAFAEVDHRSETKLKKCNQLDRKQVS